MHEQQAQQQAQQQQEQRYHNVIAANDLILPVSVSVPMRSSAVGGSGEFHGTFQTASHPPDLQQQHELQQQQQHFDSSDLMHNSTTRQSVLRENLREPHNVQPIVLHHRAQAQDREALERQRLSESAIKSELSALDDEIGEMLRFVVFVI